MLETVASRCYTLRCGKEDAVAATKSVVEQALFYRSLLGPWEKASPMTTNQQQAGRKAQEVLEAELDPALVQKIARAPVIYFAGRNNGVAEELTLKTNEITHKKSDYLEGTYAVHGIEEIMQPEEVVLVIDPFPAEMEKFKTTLVDGVGMTVIAVADRGDRRCRRSASRGSKATRPCCNCWPVGTFWSRWESPWGSTSTRPSGPARSATSSSAA